MRSLARRAGVLLPAALAVASLASAQAPRPSDLPLLPRAGRFLVQAEASWYRPGTFVDSEGQKQDFFGTPDFLLATLRLSYSPLKSFAIGIEVPYRETRVPVPEGSALSAGGSTGAGVFLVWAPSSPSRLESAIRIGYFRSRRSEDRVVTITDGSDRYCLDAAFLTLPAP